MISQCDAVIRADSFFSEMACNVGRVRLELWPDKSKWENDTLLITQIGIKERDQKDITAVLRAKKTSNSSRSDLFESFTLLSRQS